MNAPLVPFGEIAKKTATGILLFFGFFYPLFFLPFTLDFLEVNKQSLFLLFVCVSSLILIGSMIARATVLIRIGWVHLLPLLLVVVFSVSAWFSPAPYLSWIGATGSEYTSVLTVAGLAILFCLVSNIFKDNRRERMFFSLLFGATLAGLFGILSLFGSIYFPFLPTLFPSMFNTIGTITSLAVFLVTFSLFACAFFLSPTNKRIIFQNDWQRICVKICCIFLLAETIIILITIDYSLLWLLCIAGFSVLLVFLFRASSESFSPGRFILPIMMIVLSCLFWFWLPSPFRTSIPIEVTLNTQSSLEIAKKSLPGLGLYFGTGPGTYSFDFSAFHSATFNQTDFWNTRFDRGSSFFLTLLPTVGVVGTSVYGLFILVLLIFGGKNFLRNRFDEKQFFTPSVFCAWFTIALSSFFFAFNITLLITLFLFSGLLAADFRLQKKEMSFSKSKFVTFLFSILFIIVALGLFIGIFLTVQRYAADAAYTKAIRADREQADPKVIVASLDRAASLNRFRDDYYRILAQALLLRVQDELSAISIQTQPTEASKTYIQSLIAASINAAARATDLSPDNVTNWLVRAEIYRSLIGLVPRAFEFSKEAYQHATKLEPMNPSHWNEMGKMYLAHAMETQSLTVATDTTVSANAKTENAKAFSDAQEAFNKSVGLKANFAPAHFQLALLLERQGKLDEAIGKLESLGTHNPSDVGVAYELGLAYIKRGRGDDFNRAKNALQHVVTLSPSYSNAHWYLAYIFGTQKDYTKAIQEMEIVLKLNPDNVLVKTRLEKLKSGALVNMDISLPANIKNE